MDVESRVGAIYLVGFIAATYVFHYHSELWGVAAGLFTLLVGYAYKTDKRLDYFDKSIRRLEDRD